MSIELIIAVFQNSEDQAGEVSTALKKLSKEKALEVEDVAVIVKNKDGEVEVQDPGDVDKKKGTVFGAVTGGLVGLLGGPVGAIIGAAAGAATGRVTANLADYGVSDSTIEDVEKQLQPGGSAIIMYVRLNWVNQAISRLEANGATVYHETIPEGGLGNADALTGAQQR